jgi:butyrate kinase
MYDLHRCLDLQLRALNKPKPTLILPECDDVRTIEAAERLTKFARVVLLTTEEELRALIASSDLNGRFRGSAERLIRHVRCVDIAAEGELREEMARTYVELGAGKKWEASLDAAREIVRDPVHFAALAVRLGYSDMVVGGLTHASRDFFLPCLRLLERKEIVYEMALFALPDSHPKGLFAHNLVMFADVALNPVPTPEALAAIAVGACRTMRDIIPLDDLPFVNGALLSYSTRGSGEGPSVERVREAARIIPRMLEELCARDTRYETIRIEAELQISVAVSMTAAMGKLGPAIHDHPAVGRANVLIAPNLDVGNLLYHIYHTRFPDSKQLLLIGGLDDRGLDFSRSSSADEVVLGTKGMILRSMMSETYRPARRDHFFPRHRILAVNPGSTSTKMALFDGPTKLFEVAEHHDAAALAAAGSTWGQLPLRMEVIKRVLAENGVQPGSLDAVVCRGGLVRSLESGTYAIDPQMLEELRDGRHGEHPANLGAPIADLIAREYVRGSAEPAGGVKAFVVDPPVVDELDEISRITGLEGVTRRAAWHALNQKAMARKFAEERGLEVERLNLVVAHLGGGVSVGAHRKGRCVLVRDALYDGPMTPNRCGTLPQRDLIDLCYGGQDKKQVVKRLFQQGGLASHLGTTDLKEVERRIDAGDERAALVFEAMVQQVAMEIASMVPKFLGEPVDRIIVTGGMAFSERLVARMLCLLSQVNVKVSVMPGEDELEALRDGAERVLAGHESPRAYGAPASPDRSA